MSHLIVETAKLESHKQRLSYVRGWMEIQRKAIYTVDTKYINILSKKR